MPGAPLHHVGWATKLKLRGFGVFDGSRNGERRLSSCQQDFAARVYCQTCQKHVAACVKCITCARVGFSFPGDYLLDTSVFDNHVYRRDGAEGGAYIAFDAQEVGSRQIRSFI